MESNPFVMTPVEPVRPAASYIGGKRLLAKRLVERINQVDHQIYCEVFTGMGGVFLRRSARPTAEFINDGSQDVANFFRILQRHYTPFMDLLRYQLTTRHEFKRLSEIDPRTLTDLERAARFLYLQRTAYGGKVHGRTFGVSKDRPARFNITTVAPMLEDIHERLAGVTIECLPWAEFIKRYDRAGALFYLDPPYWGVEDYYGKAMFERSEFAEMAELLAGIKGRFMMSINDVPEIRDLFSRFQVEQVPVTYSAATGKGMKASELIISS